MPVTGKMAGGEGEGDDAPRTASNKAFEAPPQQQKNKCEEDGTSDASKMIRMTDDVALDGGGGGGGGRAKASKQEAASASMTTKVDEGEGDGRAKSSKRPGSAAGQQNKPDTTETDVLTTLSLVNAGSDPPTPLPRMRMWIRRPPCPSTMVRRSKEQERDDRARRLPPRR